MRFDFSPFFNPGENIPWDRVVEMMREQTRIAEEAGFSTVWITEHHMAHNGYMNAPPNPVLMGADLAAHCKKIRVGQAPVVLPDWHPLRVAEDVALLDNMTQGRVDFGAGRGLNERTTLQFNIDADRRNMPKCDALFRECLDIVIRAWTEDPFTYDGEFYRFPVPGWLETNKQFFPLDRRYHAPDGEYIGMYIHPRPYQQPHPPVWLMSNTPHTYGFAGAEGMNVIGMSNPPKKTRQCWTAFQQAASGARQREVGFGEGVGVCVVVYVAETMEEAVRDVRQGINAFYEMSNGWRPSGEYARRSYLDLGEELSAADRDSDWFDFLHAHDIVWVGTADYVAEKIEKAREEVSLQHVMLAMPFFGLPFEKVLSSLSRFGEQVLPRFEASAPAPVRVAGGMTG